MDFDEKEINLDKSITTELKNLENITIYEINKSNDFKEGMDPGTFDYDPLKKQIINSTVFVSGATETKDLNTQINDIITIQENNIFHIEANLNEIKIEDNSIFKSDFNIPQNNIDDEKFGFSNINENYEENALSEKTDIQFINFNKEEKSFLENDINLDNDEIKDKCSKIFKNFAHFYKEENDFFLSQLTLVKLLKIIGLIEEKIRTKKILIFHNFWGGGGQKLEIF